MDTLRKKFRKLGAKDSTTSDDIPATSHLPKNDAISPPVPLSPTEQLWNHAYDEIKKKDAKLISTYELILAKELHANANTNVAEIATDGRERRAQMEEIVKKGLAKAEIKASKRKAFGQVAQTLNSMKDAIATGLKPSPEASIAWAAFTGALPLLINAMDQSEKHRDGMNKVYDILVKTDTMAPFRFRDVGGFQDILRSSLEKLYQQILYFLIRATCYCNRKQLSVIARDVIKLDDWDAKVKDIQEAEHAILELDKDIKAQNTAQYQHAHLSYLQDERDEQDNACLARLMLSDPRLDRKRIEATKGGLLHDAYSWILHNDEFTSWKQNGSILWIKGDPGKGKTMLLCGIIKELNKNLAYFFCQATNNAINTGVAVLRGLLYMLADENPSLIAVIRRRLDKTNNAFDANSWYLLTDMLEEMLTKDMYIVIDALDECIEGRQELIRFIRSNHDKAKWVISSRNWSDIEEELENIPRVSLEINSSLVAQAVEYYIQVKVDQLATLKKYDQSTKGYVLQFLRERADGTFLWVALVCMSLANVKVRNIKSASWKFPSDLNELYDRMWQMTEEKDDVQLLQRILALSALVIRPISLGELQVILEIPREAVASLKEIVQDCGSFLNIRQGIIEFVHQSAKEYIDKKIHGVSESLHHEVFSRSMQAMSHILRQDIYDLKDPAVPISEVQVPKLNPLADLGYSCLNWGYHLDKYGSVSLPEATILRQFFMHYYLPWLEVASLLKATVTALTAMHSLEALIERTCVADKSSVDSTKEEDVSLSNLVNDARRFAQYFRMIFEEFPLQIYYAGLLFSPKNSTIRKTFSSRVSCPVQVVKHADDECSGKILSRPDLGSYLYVTVTTVCFPPDGERVAIGYADGFMQIWQISSTRLLHSAKCSLSLDGKFDFCIRLTFLQGTDKILCQYHSGTAAIWNPSSNHISSLDLKGVINISMRGIVAFQEKETFIQFYDAIEGRLLDHIRLDLNLFTTPDEEARFRSWVPWSFMEMFPLVFSPDAKNVAARVSEHTIEVWSVELACLRCSISTARVAHSTMALGQKYLGIYEYGDKWWQDGLVTDDSAILNLYDLESCTLIWEYSVKESLGGRSRHNARIEILQDDQFLVFSNTRSLTFETASGRCIWRSPEPGFSWLSPNLRHVVHFSGYEMPYPLVTLQNWVKTETHTVDDLEMKEKAYGDYWDIYSISPDGQRIAETKPPDRCRIVEIDSGIVLWQSSLNLSWILSNNLMLILLKDGTNERAAECFRICSVLPSSLPTTSTLDSLIRLANIECDSNDIWRYKQSDLREGSSMCTFTPDNCYVAIVRDDTRVVIWHIETQRKFLSIDCPTSVKQLQWFSNSRTIQISGNPGVILVDIDTKEELLRDHRATSMGLSDDESLLMILHPDPSWTLDDASSVSAVRDRDSHITQHAYNDSIHNEPEGQAADDFADIIEYEAVNTRIVDVGTRNSWDRLGVQDVYGTMWTEWNIEEKRGRKLSHFHPSFCMENFCFNSRFLVAIDVSRHSSNDTKIKVWERGSGRLLSQFKTTFGEEGRMNLQGNILRVSFGAITIEADGIQWGSKDECCYRDQWLWLGGKKLAYLSDIFKPYEMVYNNKTLALSQIGGKTAILRCL